MAFSKTRKREEHRNVPAGVDEDTFRVLDAAGDCSTLQTLLSPTGDLGGHEEFQAVFLAETTNREKTVG